jgi:DHA3 family macrolide efflux protein-like MFS transporter
MKNKIAVSIGGLLIYAITSFMSGLLPPTIIGLWLFAAVCMVMGAGNNVYNVPLMSYMQETIPNEKQGRAFSLLSCLMSLTQPLGLLIAGPVSELLGVRIYFIIAGSVSLAITAICIAAERKNTGRE